MSRLIYDCEIIRCIPPKNLTKKPGDGFEYCRGWSDFENMGISTIGCVDIDTEEKWFYCDQDIITDVEHYPLSHFSGLKYSETWGFNSKAFDDKLCAANDIEIKTDFDLLELVRLAAYGSPQWEDMPQGHSYSLDALARANGMTKTGSGSEAPKWWQRKFYIEVIDYCLNDCLVTAQLIKLFEEGKLRDPNSGRFLSK